MLKQLFIPVAAFAVTATGVSAFNPDMLEKIEAELTSDQVAALEVVYEMRTEGADRDEIREVLDDAGLDRETMHELRTAAKEYRHEMREAVKAAIEDGDYSDFMDAIEGTPLEDSINSEDDFETFVEAHELMQSGDKEGAQELFEELGIERGQKGGHGKGHGGGEGGLGRGFDRDGEKGFGSRGGNES